MKTMIDFDRARVYAIPMVTRFRGIDVREGVLIEGPAGWGDFCAFPEYDDRRPWLLAIGAWLREHDGAGAVVTCSALKRRYRDTLREAAPTITFLHLHGDKDTVRRRVGARPGHFMPTSLVDSQFADLEPLGDDEQGTVADLSLPVDVIVARFLE